MRDGVVHLDTRRQVFEFAPLLVELLSPYPHVNIVLTTRWLQRLTLDEVVFCLPPELAWRVVGAIQDSGKKLSYPQGAIGERNFIVSYAYRRRLKTWLVIGDENPCPLEYKFSEPVEHFLLLDPARGISDVKAYEFIQRWLSQVHRTDNFFLELNGQEVSDISNLAKPIFSLSQLESRPPQTPEQIKRLIKEGRFSEMSPRQAGYDEEN
jgi:hypothetical protein